MKKNNGSDSVFESLIVKVVYIGVLLNGILIILTTLFQLLILRGAARPTQLGIDVSILVGITLIYFSNLLRRQKQTAWVVVLLIYAFYIVVNLVRVDSRIIFLHHHLLSLRTLQDIVLPVVVISGLVISRKAYNVKSDIQSFGSSLRVILIIFIVTFSYGLIGFRLLNKNDFHQKISLSGAAERTIDQLSLTTTNQLTTYSKRATLFEDSLNVVSVVGLGYILLSLFQPLKARLEDQDRNRELTTKLLESGKGTSEDFFKLWPHDKNYFFNKQETAGLAYRVHRSIALVAGDPFGAVAEFKDLVKNFTEFCRLNDWQPSFIHTEPHFNPLYKNQDFILQKIGEEAIVEVDHFQKNVSKNKYFRNISSKFEKQGYSIDVLKPPHDLNVLKRLEIISNDWLKLPGRSERGFMIGYFSYSYMQQNNILVLRDDTGTIQAFLNQIKSFDHDEANYDLIRHTRGALGNSTDFVLMNFILFAQKEGFKRVNLGLCPLVGLEKDDNSRGIIDKSLSFLYANGDRLYSFNGLHRFKQKYEPNWSDRFIAYKKGVRGFTRTATALNIAMKPHRFHSPKS